MTRLTWSWDKEKEEDAGLLQEAAAAGWASSVRIRVCGERCKVVRIVPKL